MLGLENIQVRVEHTQLRRGFLRYGYECYSIAPSFPKCKIVGVISELGPPSKSAKYKLKIIFVIIIISNYLDLIYK
jgi:hypothetical protein